MYNIGDRSSPVLTLMELIYTDIYVHTIWCGIIYVFTLFRMFLQFRMFPQFRIFPQFRMFAQIN